MLSAHAALVLAERGIPLVWIANVLVEPVRTEPDKADPALRHALAPISDYDGRVLRVVSNDTTWPWRIITAYFDRRERKGR